MAHSGPRFDHWHPMYNLKTARNCLLSIETRVTLEHHNCGPERDKKNFCAEIQARHVSFEMETNGEDLERIWPFGYTQNEKFDK